MCITRLYPLKLLYCYTTQKRNKWGLTVRRIISVPLQAGGTVAIEVEDSTPVTRGDASRSVIQKSLDSFEKAIATVQPVAVAVVQQFASTVAGTNSVKVKFGLKFSAEAGAIIASASSDANFEIEVSWGQTGSR
jgi:Trypsin-co-occurring domain 1